MKMHAIIFQNRNLSSEKNEHKNPSPEDVARKIANMFSKPLYIGESD